MYKILPLSLLYIGVLTLSSCSTYPQQDLINEQVQVATFNEIIKNNHSSNSIKASTYCLGIKTVNGIEDPNQRLLQNIEHSTAIEIRPYSACYLKQSTSVDFQRKKTISFYVEKPNCYTSKSCIISGGYYEGNLSSQTNMYKASLIGKRWIVKLISEGPIS